MKWILLLFSGITMSGCNGIAQENEFKMIKELPAGLKEISGIAKDGNLIWVISDDPSAAIYKLDLSGNVLQKITLDNITFTDVEAVTADGQYVYIGDLGDNDGSRDNRTIIRVLKNNIPQGDKVTAKGDLISFVFPDEVTGKKKKKNNYDCEAMISYKDSLFIFTKRREDLQTELFALPAIPGTYNAKKIALFNSGGLVTDAGLNSQGDKLALSGYDPGHTKPFIWLFSNFTSSNFFTGNKTRIELTNKKKLDWQVEGITWNNDQSLYISCERTKDVNNTLYLVDTSALIKAGKSF